MRLFLAIDIEQPIRERIARFVEGVHDFAPEARWVGAESFHITLKFIGEKPPETAEEIKRLLRQTQAQATTLSFRGHGFFPNLRSPRVFWIGIHADAQLRALAETLDRATATLGTPREEHAFSPHLTLARGGAASHPRGGWGSPHQRGEGGKKFFRLQEKLGAMPEPDFGAMTATEFFLYESKLSPKGAQYTKLEGFPLSPPPGWQT